MVRVVCLAFGDDLERLRDRILQLTGRPRMAKRRMARAMLVAASAMCSSELPESRAQVASAR
jgi:hypothetical protein